MDDPATFEIDRTISRISSGNADGYGIMVRRLEKPGDGWFPATELASEECPLALVSGVRGMSEIPAEHIRAEWMLESVARAIADLGGSFLVAAGRLPVMDPGNLVLAAEGGLVRATGVLGAQMLVLPGDPAEGMSGVTLAAGWEDLADRFREGFTALLSPVVTWLDGNGLRPQKTLWHAAADRLAQSLIWSGEAFGKSDFARQVTARVVNGDERLRIPLETEVDFYEQEYHLRSTCCLAYRTPEGDLCQGCPLNR